MEIVKISFLIYLKCLLYLLIIYTISWSAITGRIWKNFKKLMPHIVASGYFVIQLITLLINLSGKSIAFAISVTDPARTIILVCILAGSWVAIYANDKKSSNILINMSRKLVENNN